MQSLFQEDDSVYHMWLSPTVLQYCYIWKEKNTKHSELRSTFCWNY